MKCLLQILLLGLMLLQAMPVNYWVMNAPMAVCLTDESTDENSCKEGKKEKADYKDYLSHGGNNDTYFFLAADFPSLILRLPLLPHLELSTPPPDACV